jgi:uncharacterized membrane protein
MIGSEKSEPRAQRGIELSKLLPVLFISLIITTLYIIFTQVCVIGSALLQVCRLCIMHAFMLQFHCMPLVNASDADLKTR